MYTRKKSLREEIFKTNSDNIPSFSSTLLDEIYRSIDENQEMNQVQKAEKIGKKYMNKSNEVEDEEMASLRRARLVEKWMDKKVEEKNFSRRPPLIPDFEKDQVQQDNDPLFFSSTSNSSVSSSGVLSSSDTEYFAAVEKTRKSCFGTSWPKPIRTKVPLSVPQEKTEDSMKSKKEALKIYDNLKNLKQPISPGARLTNFINSLFTNGNSKKNNHISKSGKSKSAQTSTCSSATSFSRSLLSRTPSTTSKVKLNQEISKRKVSFTPVSVIVDEECRPSGHKCIDEKESNAMLKIEDLKVCQNQKKDDFAVESERSVGEDEDDDEEGSDCSSELFEIDHLVLFGKKRFCEELPVYETTDLGKNLAIARGLMR